MAKQAKVLTQQELRRVLDYVATRKHADRNLAILLTDNHNPLEYLQPEKSVQYRKILFNWFSGDLLAI